MRVVAGKYKGRRFDVPHTFKARPTTDFAKENIFNVMRGYIDMDGADALDLFAGTGSISIELLSRGCHTVVSVENDRSHALFIRKCIDKIAAEGSTVVRGDAFKYIKGCRQKFDIVFADPPYALDNLESLPRLILDGGLLKKGGLLVLEHGKDNDFSQSEGFVEHRTYGSVNFSLFLLPDAQGTGSESL